MLRCATPIFAVLTSPPMPRQLLSKYSPKPVRYDELLSPEGLPRGHWRRLIETLAGASEDAMRERAQWVRRRVSENGVTYNVYDDSEGASRPWELDLVPLILPPQEWSGIEAAVAQRATLLNRVLMDIYGEQRLLAEGLLPPALIYGHAGFLRPIRGLPAPGGVMLHLYAADLARDPDGRWWVVDDRTQAPSGAGYALENRLVISRLFPELFREQCSLCAACRGCRPRGHGLPPDGRDVWRPGQGAPGPHHGRGRRLTGDLRHRRVRQRAQALRVRRPDARLLGWTAARRRAGWNLARRVDRVARKRVCDSSRKTSMTDSQAIPSSGEFRIASASAR